MGLQRWRSMFW